jgi:hypothetical protein
MAGAFDSRVDARIDPVWQNTLLVSRIANEPHCLFSFQSDWLPNML